MPLFQPRHSVEQLHEFSFLCPDQFPADTIGHIEATTVAVFVGNNQMKGLHHQFLVLLQGPGEILIGFHAHQGHNGFPFPGRQRMIQPHRFCDKTGVDYQNVVRFAGTQLWSAARCFFRFARVSSSANSCMEAKVSTKGSFFRIIMGMLCVSALRILLSFLIYNPSLFISSRLNFVNKAMSSGEMPCDFIIRAIYVNGTALNGLVG